MEITPKYLSSLGKIGKGACADVYKYGDKALKVLNESGRAITNLQETSKLVGIKNDTFVLPEEILTGADGKIIGYILELVDGQAFIDDNIIKNVDFDTLKGAIAKVEQDLQQLSANKVVCNDLNHKNIMWDTTNGCIKIIDTDSFIVNEDLTEEQIYGMNLEQFNNQIELVLGNSGNTKMQVLRNNPKFAEVQRKYVIGQVKGQKLSITILIDCLVNIAEEQFGRKFNSLQEIEQAIQESEIQQENANKIASFEEYKSRKQQITEQQTENIRTSQIGIKQKIANFLADKKILRKIPFIDRFVAKEQRLLPETTQQREDKITAHTKFEDEISGHGKYKNLFLGKPVKNVSLEMNRQKIPESHSMVDPEKIAQMKKKMDGKSLEDDL